MNTFYLDDQQCLNHLIYENCEIYNLEKKNICEICKDNSYNFKILKKCKVKEEIPNCVSYSFDFDIETLECLECDDFYHLSSNTCEGITF